MCNCGCDTHISEAKDLQKKAVVMFLFAAAILGVPGMMSSAAHPHHGVVAAVIAVELVLVARAAWLMMQRKRLLRDAAAL